MTSSEIPTEPVWTYRGYQLRPSEFNTAMVHFFRAEIQRANVWRTRLDTTTNWAVVSTGAAISFAFGDPNSHAGVILLDMLLVTMFLWMEARRYRYYELWSSRVRLMETDFFAAMLVPPFQPSPDWAETLAESLLQPHFPISMLEALGRRLRRNYVWIYVVLALAWLGKLWLHPEAAAGWSQIAARAAIGPIISGWMVISAISAAYIALLLLAVLTVGLHEASGEVLPRFALQFDDLLKGRKAWFRHGAQRKQLIALIITDQAQTVAASILTQLKRGVTSMPGTGMYTGKEHAILLCALTVTEASQLKAVVSKEDPNAFVIVSPAQEILGKGFSPLQNDR